MSEISEERTPRQLECTERLYFDDKENVAFCLACGWRVNFTPSHKRILQENKPDILALALAAERAAGRVEGLTDAKQIIEDEQVKSCGEDWDRGFLAAKIRISHAIDARLLALRSADKTGDGTI